MSTKLKEKTAAEAADRPIGAFQTLHEDDKTKITHWVIKPGEQTGWHRHEFDYVAVQQSTGRLHFDHADGSTREVDYTPGVAKAVAAPVEHNATNVGDVDIVVMEIEYKT
jgi:mannose-6-phosphate isomerase-like protein (cupin superfamily)